MEFGEWKCSRIDCGDGYTSLWIYLLFSHLIVSHSLWPHGLQHSRLLCPSPSLELAQTHVHWTDEAIQLSHPLSSTSPAFNFSQHQSLFQHHSSKASVLQHSAFFMGQLSHPYMTAGKTIALTRRTFIGKVMSLLFKMLSRLVIAFLLRNKVFEFHGFSHHLQWFWSPGK